MDSESSASGEAEVAYKVLILGNGAVGKTSLIKRYCEESFGQSYKQTIGLDFYSKKLDFPGLRHVTLQIWDIGGQQIGGSMIANYVHGADAVCYVYDVTNFDSLKDIEDWHNCVMATLNDEKTPQPLMVLVGNKTDLPNRQVSPMVHERAAAKKKMGSFFISASSGEKVNALFTKIAAQLSGVEVTEQELDMTNRVVANVESSSQRPVSVLESTQVVPKVNDPIDECVVI